MPCGWGSPHQHLLIMKKNQLLLAFCLLLTTLKAQKTIHVTATGAGAMDGRHWSSAYADLGKALSEAI